MDLGTTSEPVEVSRTKNLNNSRYNFDKNLLTGQFTTLPSRDVLASTDAEEEDDHYVTKPEDRGRLDRVSYKFYHTERFWWVLGEINKVKNPLRVPPGTVLKIPTLSKIYSQIVNKTQA